MTIRTIADAGELGIGGEDVLPMPSQINDLRGALGLPHKSSHKSLAIDRLLEQFDTWADRRVLSHDTAKFANLVRHYLVLAERGRPLPEPAKRGLCNAVDGLAAALRSPYDANTKPFDSAAVRQSFRPENSL